MYCAALTPKYLTITFSDVMQWSPPFPHMLCCFNWALTYLTVTFSWSLSTSCHASSLLKVTQQSHPFPGLCMFQHSLVMFSKLHHFFAGWCWPPLVPQISRGWLQGVRGVTAAPVTWAWPTERNTATAWVYLLLTLPLHRWKTRHQQVTEENLCWSASNSQILKQRNS